MAKNKTGKPPVQGDDKDYTLPELNHDNRTMSGTMIPNGPGSRYHRVNDSLPFIRRLQSNKLHVEVQHAMTGLWHTVADATYGTLEWAIERGCA